MKSSLPVIILLAGIYLFFFLQPMDLISPDELSYLFFSKHFAETGRLFYSSPGDRIMEERGFIPRKFHYNSEGEIVSRKPPGLIIAYGTFQRLVSLDYARSFFPILAIVVLYLFYLLSGCVFRETNLRLASVLLLASMPLFLLRSYACSPAMLNLAVFISSLLFLHGVIERGRWYHYLGLGIMAGLMIWVRQTSVLLWIPLGSGLLIGHKRLIKIRLIWSGAGIVILLALYLIYNQYIYGNFLALSYTVQFSNPGQAGAGESINNFFRIVRFHPRIWILHLVSIPLTFSVAFPPLVLAIVGFCIAWKEGAARRWLFLAGITFLVLIAFFANFETYGFAKQEINLRSSFLRYCFPALIFLPLGTVFFLSRQKQLFTRFLIILITFNIIIALVAPLGLLDSFYLGYYYRQVKGFILENTDENSVVLSNYWDKMVFPERLVFSSISGRSKEQLADLISLIIRKGYRPVYIEHPRDRDAFQSIKDDYLWEKISGPKNLKGLLKKMKPPGDIYPVVTYKYREPLTGTGR